MRILVFCESSTVIKMVLVQDNLQSFESNESSVVAILKLVHSNGYRLKVVGTDRFYTNGPLIQACYQEISTRKASGESYQILDFMVVGVDE